MKSGTLFEHQIETILFGAIPQMEQEEPPIVETRSKHVVILSGPTACGKSALALMLAPLIKGEIISADSMQVYRGMDIGTAKPTLQEMEQVPHHLFNIRDIAQGFNVVDYYYEAKNACRIIHDRGGIPVFVGGSGFYIHSILYGPPGGPPSIPELRKSFEEMWDDKGGDFLYHRLEQVDPQYAATITRNDKHKIVRALEIITMTGTKVSRNAWKKRKLSSEYIFHCWFLHRPRTTLYHRIEKRCEKMLEDGLLDEVSRLESEIYKNPSAAQAIGYRQSLDYLKTSRSKEDYRIFVEEFKKASRHYAKRQFTWFRREPIFRWIDLDLHDPETVIDIMSNEIEHSQ
jgi:tRNA dimethylallyltransferase